VAGQGLIVWPRGRLPGGPGRCAPPSGHCLAGVQIAAQVFPRQMNDRLVGSVALYSSHAGRLRVM